MSSRVRACLRWCGIALAILLAGGCVALLILWLSLPSIEAPFDYTPTPSSQVVDRNGVLLYDAMDADAGAYDPVSLEDIPDYLEQAAIATEDASFYSNPGFDVRGLVRALWLNLRSGEIVSGGSTITQQVARNLLMQAEERQEQTLLRKAREILLAYKLSQHYEKDEILALYLNTTYLGNMAYGVEVAAWRYFDRPVSQLDLAQCALIAGLAQAPTSYDPYVYPEAAFERQQVVLGLMEGAGYIDSGQVQAAVDEEINFSSDWYKITAPHFTLEVLSKVAALYPEEIQQGGLVIETTLDASLQTRVEEIVDYYLAALNANTTESAGHNVNNAAVVVLSIPDGEILALVGSPDYFDESIAGAVNAARALRQTGSSIKPLTYAAAFERGYSPASVICDVPVTFTTAEGTLYSPRNYDLVYHGPTPLRTALACSYNIVAVRLLDQIGIDALMEMAHRLGIDNFASSQQAGLALTLGSAEVSLVDLTEAYGAFASGGTVVESFSVARVLDVEGNELYTAPEYAPQQAVSPAVASLITDVLSDSAAREPAFGSTSVLETPFGAAVKTGTTTDFHDNWTVGYTSDYVVGVWVGNADNSPMDDISGIDGAAPIWHDVMLTVQSEDPEPFEPDTALVEVEVCPDSGLLPNAACPHTVTELFLPENMPTATCDMHRFVEVDAATGLLADDTTPESRIVTRRVTIWPAEAQAWAVERGLVSNLQVELDETDRQGTGLKIAYPANGAIYCISGDVPPATQRIQVQVDAHGSSFVELFCDGESIASWTTRPCLAFWQLVPGEHVFSVISGDYSDSISITVNESCTGERISQ